MQPKSRFTRKTDTAPAVTKQNSDYDKLLRSGFRALDLEIPREEKVEALKKEYFMIASPDIERNAFLLERLTKLKLEIQDKPKKKLSQYFIQMVALLREANIINEIDFNELIFFKKKEIVPVPRIDSEDQNIPLPKLIVLDGRVFHKDKKLSEIIIKYMKINIETEDSLDKKKKAIQIAYQMYKQVDWSRAPQECEVEFSLYGSCVNQLSTRSSDVDITLNTSVDCSEREFITFFRRQIDPIVRKHKVKEESRLAIRVPVIEITLNEYDVTISFSVNNKLGSINSRMLELYTKLDPRCQELGLLVKMWATANGIISAKNHFLSSYAYNLMVINFLQTIQPPVLPSLQALRANDPNAEPKMIKVRTNSKIQEMFETRIDYEDDEEKLKVIMERDYSDNKMNVVELLQRFFKFYKTHSNFSGVALSVRTGKHIPRGGITDKDTSKYFYSIEDPFDLDHNPGKYVTVGSENAMKIIDIMNLSHYYLKKKKVLDALSKV